MSLSLPRAGAVLAILLMAGCASTVTAPTPSTPAPAVSTAPAPEAALKAGTSVYANRTGDQWYPATVLSAANGTVSVQYTDGSTEKTTLTEAQIALAPTGPQAVMEGDTVIAKWTSTWWRGRIVSVDGANLKILYSDNTDGAVTSSEITRPLDGKLVPVEAKAVASSVPAAPAGKEPVATAAEPFPVGMSILGNWKKGQAWYPGKIVSAGATYSVHYEDGSDEEGITRMDLAHFPGGPQDVKVGDTVVAEWRPATWWGAKVTKVDGDNVSILYSDSTTGTLKKTQFTKPGA